MPAVSAEGLNRGSAYCLDGEAQYAIATILACAFEPLTLFLTEPENKKETNS
jgi:hypothetical protein